MTAGQGDVVGVVPEAVSVRHTVSLSRIWGQDLGHPPDEDATPMIVFCLPQHRPLLPAELDFAPLLAEAKRQLHEEADYAREGEQMMLYRELLAGEEHFVVPAIAPEFSTARVLAMDFLPGRPVEELESAPQDERGRTLRPEGARGRVVAPPMQRPATAPRPGKPRGGTPPGKGRGPAKGSGPVRGEGRRRARTTGGR